jgi:hypothetical protein
LDFIHTKSERNIGINIIIDHRPLKAAKIDPIAIPQNRRAGSGRNRLFEEWKRAKKRTLPTTVSPDQYGDWSDFHGRNAL